MDARGFAALDRSFARFIVWSRDVKGYTPATLGGYERGYTNFIRFWRSHPRLSGLTLLDRWVAWNRTRISATTLNGYWRGARAFFKFRHDRQHRADLFAGQSAPPCPRALPKALRADQCRAVLHSALQMHWHNRYVKERATAIIATILYTGLRAGEICRLRLDEVDLATGTIRITRGKGRGGGRDRIAYIPPQLDPVFRRYIRCRERYGVTIPQLFVQMDGETPINQPIVRRMFWRIRDELGFRLCPQILRHSFVTHMLQCGIPLHIASGLVGHATIQTTMGYLRIWNEEYEHWAKKIRY